MAILMRRWSGWALLIVVQLLAAQAVAAQDLVGEGFTVPQQQFGRNHFLTLCYHAITPKGIAGDPYTITREQFIGQIEYLRTHGFHFVSLDQILAAKAGGAPLPAQAVLLTFDDAYVSYAEFVAPFLSLQKIPSLVAVIGNFVNAPPEKLPEPIMSWAQIRAVSKNPYVEVVSHSFDLHHAIQYNAVGNVAAATTSRYFNAKLNRYESEAEYRARLRRDFAQQQKVFMQQLGFKPRAMVWPYGRYNAVAVQVAAEFGMPVTFTLVWGINDVHHLSQCKRVMIETNPAQPNNPNIEDFVRNVKQPNWDSQIIRAVQLDLDLIYDPKSYAQTDHNLGLVIERLVKMGVNRVYLQAFADPDGDGNVEGVYFPNRVLPMVADLFSHAAHQISIRGIDVYAWMPTLAVTFPDADFNHRHRVYEQKQGVVRETRAWYHRLSPFSAAAQARMVQLYEDLAIHAQISGILFQDDAYLNDFEDYNPAALRAYRQAFGADFVPQSDQQDRQAALRWARFKGQAINRFLDALQQATLKYRPDAKFDRNLYAAVLTDPAAEAWFAQSIDDYLAHYDRIVVMAYPEMEQQTEPLAWLKHLVRLVRAHPGALARTVFKLQAFDWSTNRWIDSAQLRRQMRAILAAGGVHLAYYPDSVFADQPKLSTITMEMSLDALQGVK